MTYTYEEFKGSINKQYGIHEYIQSEEDYKGFRLVIVMRRFDTSEDLTFHRKCYIFKDGECVGIDKTKKSAKELIDYNCFK